MKYYIDTVLLFLLAVSCSDDVQKWDNWPEWKLISPLSVGGEVLDEELRESARKPLKRMLELAAN